MSSKDRWDSPADIVVSDAAATTGDGQDQPSTLSNRRRRERVELRIRGDLTVTGNGAGPLRNRGSVLGAVSRLKYRIGGKPILDIDARCARALAEIYARSTLPTVRALNALIQVTTLSEVVPLWLARPGMINTNETKYLDPVGENQKIEVVLVPSKKVNLPGILDAAAVATMPNLVASLQDVYDEMVTQLPDYRVWVDEIVQQVAATQGNLRVDLRLTRQISGILIQLDSDLGEVGTGSLINTFTLKTDRNTFFNKVSWNNYIEHMHEEFGQAVQDTKAYAFIDFTRYGRASSWLDPVNEDTGLRFEFDVNVAGLTNPLIRIVPVQYERVPGATAVQTAVARALGR